MLPPGALPRNSSRAEFPQGVRKLQYVRSADDACLALHRSCGLCFSVVAQPPPGQFPLHTVELDSEAAWASDIFLAESGARFEQELNALRWDVSFTYNAYSIEYEPFRPFDFFGFPENLHEDRFGG